MHSIICFGDSNTYGYNPETGGKYPGGSWVDYLSLHTGTHMINLGVLGRTIPGSGSEIQSAAGQLISLQHSGGTQSVSPVWIMLGSNDLLCGCTAVEAAEKMRRFLFELHRRNPAGPLCLIAPVKMQRGSWVYSDELIVESEKLQSLYEDIAASCGTDYISTRKWEIPLAFDGVHFTQEGHKIFARNLQHTYM